jgi:hypothetical protein
VKFGLQATFQISAVFPSDRDVGYTSVVVTDIAYFWDAGVQPSS